MAKHRSRSSRVSPLVRQAVEAILNRLDEKPRLIVLFGSEARGEAAPDSDVDILVVLGSSRGRLIIWFD